MYRAFGVTAAVETSNLSELGVSADEDKPDLSEHHLARLAKNHLPAEGCFRR